MQNLIAQCWLPVTERLSSQDLLRQLNQGVRKLEKIVPVSITALMPVGEIFKHLIHYGIVDLTPNFNPSSIALLPFQLGGSSDVYAGYLYNNTRVAVEVGRPRADEVDAGKCNLLTAHELYVWSKCNHPNVIPLAGAIIFRRSIASVSPWAENGYFGNYLENKKDMSVEARLDICIHISEAISYLHGIGIAIIVNPDNDLCFESFDSGYTWRWAPPEVLMEDSGKTTHSDVYSLGMTILVCC
ncbi:hypothetical protein BN14_09225 [Rhizoctonia solani AG-1 IB]|uniref:Protein kinase domain-containing protein n=1 Tax=Thanatephorus cucumeris (strain AG1-IB / isolate 7/3/14) TaxID=1108050 RepID=M5C7U8_THACB|nr:hypothetical protein BN14_09225 [Rhizoctonia solani AG-1 IB]